MASRRVQPPPELVGYIASVSAPPPARAEGRALLPAVLRTGGWGPIVMLVVVLVLLAIGIVGITLALHGPAGPLPANRIVAPTSRRSVSDPSAPIALLH